MPLYEFVCRKCGSEFEALLKNSSEEVVCVNCGEGHPERKLSRFSPGRSGSGRQASCCGGADNAACGCPSVAAQGLCSGCCGGHGHRH